MKIIVDGEFVISDGTGQKVTGRKGDVFYFPKGSKITFETSSFGLGFFVGQRMVSFFLWFLMRLSVGVSPLGAVALSSWSWRRTDMN